MKKGRETGDRRRAVLILAVAVLTVSSLRSPVVFAMSIKRNPHSIVIVGGDRYDSWVDKQFFKQVTVELMSQQASAGLFRVFDPRFKFLDKYTSGDGVPELPMEFYMGFGEDLGQPIFWGYLARVERGPQDTTFRALDYGQKMKREKITDYHIGKHDLQIIQLLAERRGLKFKFIGKAPALDPHDTMIQDSKNDWEHAIERAREAGFVLYVRQNTLFCGEPPQLGSPIITLRNRKKEAWLFTPFDMSWKLPENHYGRHKVVEHRGRKRGGRRLSGESETHPRGTKKHHMTTDPAIHTKNYVARTAHASKALNREHAFVCNVRQVPPLPGVRPDFRDTIQLEEFGKLFSGPYIVDQVRHDHSGNDFVTEYQLYRDLQ